MKIFISWSGEPSKSVAKALRNWLPSVIQSIEPWMSDSDIYAGERWAAEIGTELESTDFGIICVTLSNQTSSWLNFEAGALSKRVKNSRVVPYIFNMKLAELAPGPLTQFHAKIANKESTRELLNSINQILERPLEVSIINSVFVAMWPQLEIELTSLSNYSEPKIEKRSLEEKVDEILSINREFAPMASLNHIIEKLNSIDQMIRPDSSFNSDHNWNEIYKHSRAVIKAFMKPAYITVDRESMSVLVTFKKTNNFHLTNLLRYKTELEQTIKQILGSGYSLSILPEDLPF